MVWQYLHDPATESNLVKSAKLLRDMILDAVKEFTPVLQLTTHAKYRHISKVNRPVPETPGPSRGCGG
jgi:hypothetical protein